MKHTSRHRKRTSKPRAESPRVAYTLTGYHERVLLELRELLWPARDPDEEWSSDTIEEVACVLDRHGFGRHKR